MSTNLFAALFCCSLLPFAVPQLFSSQQSFEQQALSEHNYYRALHGVSQLKWSKELQDMAQNWANNLARLKSMFHSDNKNVGENIYWAQNMLPDRFAANGCKFWYDEYELYDFNNPGFSMITGHFTQLVWKDTKLVGCAKAASVDKIVFCVCNYKPPGNMEGAYEQNVFKARY